MKKKLTMVAALVLVFALGVTGTLAYLTAQTDSITNTFTVGNVKIELTETGATAENSFENTYKLIPGQEYTKNPTVTVKANSEKCWLFVKFEEKDSPSDYLTYTSNLGKEGAGWTKLEDVDNVWYRTVETSTSDVKFELLEGNKVIVKDTLGNDALGTSENVKKPQLVYTAYAIQDAGFTTAAAAWAEVSK